jgi:hypothetical protein
MLGYLFISDTNYECSQTCVKQPPLGPEKVAVWKRGLILVRFRLVIDELNWSLLTGGRCSVVTVKAGLTVI